MKICWGKLNSERVWHFQRNCLMNEMMLNCWSYVNAASKDFDNNHPKNLSIVIGCAWESKQRTRHLWWNQSPTINLFVSPYSLFTREHVVHGKHNKAQSLLQPQFPSTTSPQENHQQQLQLVFDVRQAVSWPLELAPWDQLSAAPPRRGRQPVVVSLLLLALASTPSSSAAIACCAGAQGSLLPATNVQRRPFLSNSSFNFRHNNGRLATVCNYTLIISKKRVKGISWNKCPDYEFWKLIKVYLSLPGMTW